MTEELQKVEEELHDVHVEISRKSDPNVSEMAHAKGLIAAIQ